MRNEVVWSWFALVVASACVEAAAFVPVGSTPEEFRAFVAAETRRYAAIVQETKISMQN
jgi:tripartite-type tricarboxylate transporter receptor subunit TctC